MNKTLTNLLATVMVLVWLPLAARAITINATYENGAGQTWSATQKEVIQQAINDWQAALPDSHTVNVNFDFTNAGTGSYLGMWEGGYSLYPDTNVYPWTSGVTHNIHFNVDYFSGTNYTWWDPTPTTSGDQPFAAWDALSVARHEIGHMMGIADDFYVDHFYTPQQIDKWGSHITGSTFDPGGLNVSLASAYNLSHVLDSGATAGDLMVPNLYNGQRRGISATDLNMLHLAYNYTVVPPKTPTTYTLTATAGKTKMHVGDSSTITATLTNTGTGTADTIDYTGLRATATSGFLSGSSTSGNQLANAGGSASNSGLSFSSTSAGTITITPAVTATNHTLGTSATLSGTTSATVTVYSGQGVWNTTGSGNWLDSSKWTALGGVPGIDGILSANDTATFSKNLSSAATINLNGATPRLKSLTFDTPNKSFTLAQGTGGTLTLQASAGNASISVLNGSDTISAPVILGSDATISGPGTLNLSGGITGHQTLTVTGILNASSIQVNTLRIGTLAANAAPAPEPSTLALFGMGIIGLLVFYRHRR